MLEKSLFTSAANLEPCSVTGANRDVFVLRYCQGTSHLLCDVSICECDVAMSLAQAGSWMWMKATCPLFWRASKLGLLQLTREIKGV